MDQPPPGDGPPEGGATKHSKFFLAAMGAIIVPIVVLVGFMLTRRPDPGMIEVSCSRVADNDALLIRHHLERTRGRRC